MLQGAGFLCYRSQTLLFAYKMKGRRKTNIEVIVENTFLQEILTRGISKLLVRYGPTNVSPWRGVMCYWTKSKEMVAINKLGMPFALETGEF